MIEADRASSGWLEGFLESSWPRVQILYLDESGTHSDARYLVVAGVAVFETETYYLARELDALQERYFPGMKDPLAFHASPLQSALGQSKDPYPMLDRTARRALANDIYTAIARANVRLFAVAMEKSFIPGECYDRGFER